MTGVEDQLEETELVLQGLREYHRRVKDRQRLEDEIEYNLQMAGQHLMDRSPHSGNSGTTKPLTTSTTPCRQSTGLTAGTWIGTSRLAKNCKRSRPNSGRSATNAAACNSPKPARGRQLRTTTWTVTTMYRPRDDQASVDEFVTERKRLREPYKCENCSEIQEYDPEIAGDAIPCHSCNSPSDRRNANSDEVHLMRPRKGDR